MATEHKRLEVPFTQVANSILNDKNLSFKAKGLFAFIYSKPSGWDFSAERIAAQSGDGETSVTSGLEELESRGYLVRTKLPTGKMEYLLTYEPNPGNPRLAFSQTGEIADISNKEVPSNKDRTSETFVSPLSSRSQERTVEEVDEDGNPIARVFRSKRVVRIDRDWSWANIEMRLAASRMPVDKLVLRYLRRKGITFANQGHWEIERIGLLKVANALIKAGVNSTVFDTMCDMAEEVKDDWTIHTAKAFLSKALQQQ
jgi:hypothetical protein